MIALLLSPCAIRECILVFAFGTHVNQKRHGVRRAAAMEETAAESAGGRSPRSMMFTDSVPARHTVAEDLKTLKVRRGAVC